MNYVKMMGGLGNQLFEYTFAKYIECISGKPSILYTDVYNTESEKRTFELDRFNCDYSEVRGTLLCSSMITEYEMPDDLRVDHTFFAGYWQDRKYYNKVKDQISGVVSLKKEFITERIRHKAREILGCRDSVAMHIRRGDYLEGINTMVFESQPMEYYKSALLRIIDILGYRPTVYVFSDDYEYICSRPYELAGCQFIQMEPEKDYEDMYLMSCASHHIIANSSFSWWGAALSGSGGITIMPGKWFKDRKDPELDIDGWIKL